MRKEGFDGVGVSTQICHSPRICDKIQCLGRPPRKHNLVAVSVDKLGDLHKRCCVTRADNAILPLSCGSRAEKRDTRRISLISHKRKIKLG